VYSKCKCGNIIKNFYAKLCKKCYLKTLKGKGNPNWRSSSICIECGGKRVRHNKTKLCGTCYKEKYIKGLPECIGCSKSLSRYDSLEVGTGYCQKCYRGDKTRRWNSELTPEFRKQGRTVNPDYYIWRNKVFARDKYTCQKCGDNKGGNLVAHHKNSFATIPELRVSLDNGITFCEICHKKFHKKFGYFNNTKIQIGSF